MKILGKFPTAENVVYANEQRNSDSTRELHYLRTLFRALIRSGTVKRCRALPGGVSWLGQAEDITKLSCRIEKRILHYFALMDYFNYEYTKILSTKHNENIDNIFN